MSDRSMKVAASALAIVLGLTGVEAIGFSEGAIAQEQISEIDRAMEAAMRLGLEGSKDSFTAAIAQFEIVARLSKAENNRVKQSVAIAWLGFIYSALGEKQKALEYYNQVLLLYRTVGDKSGEASTLNSIGLIYDEVGETQKALKYYNQSLPIDRAVGDKSGEAATLNNLGGVYFELGEKQKALDFYSQSLRISRAVGNRAGEATTLNAIGLVYHTLGENQKALEYYNNALPLSHAVGDRGGEAATLNNIGSVYTALDEKQKALEFYNQSLPIWRVVGDRSGEASTLNNIGGVYSVLGKKQKALEFYNQSLPILRAVGDRSGEAATLNNIGLVYDDLGKKQKALEFYNQSLPMLRAVGNRSGEATMLNNIGHALNQEQADVAIVFYKQSVNFYEFLRKDIRKLPRETQEIYTSSVAKTYRSLANLLLTQGRIREAQSILELLKVQELQGYGKDQEANASPIQFPFHPLESQALQTIEQTIASKSLTLESLKTIGQPLTQNRDRITQDMNAMPIAIGNPQAVLKANPNALLIQNLVVGDKLWVLWTNASGNTKAIVVPNVTKKELTTTVETFRKDIGSPYSNLNELKATSQKLHNWLIPSELQAELKNNPKPQLIFSLDHVTRYIPVAALYDGKDYLAQRYTLSNLITMDSDMGDRLSPEGRSPSILGLGTSKRYGDFSALENVPAELRAIVQDGNAKGIYPGKIQLNEAFTAKSLSENLNSFRVLHIATHGSFNPKSITASFLLLGNGDRLPITDIAALNNLNSTHLSVLSACETGISGQGQDGTEISGISDYFLRRGAKSVLASLWSVNDASTSLLMQQFYQNLSTTKMTKSQALQKSQQDFISGKFTPTDALKLRNEDFVANIPDNKRRTIDYSHPFFWAPFVLTGNNQ